MNNYVFLDFEFNDTSERILNLVSVVAYVCKDGGLKRYVFWLHLDMKEQIKFNNFIDELIKEEFYFVAFAVIAEARSLLSLPFPPDVTKMKWIDLWVEYRNLKNNSNKLSYGKQLIKGKIRKTNPPNPKWMGPSGGDNSKSEDNYAAACYKLLDIEIDTERKTLMRDIIISKDEDLIEKHKKEILDYNEDDVINLPKMLSVVIKLYQSRYPKKLHKNIGQWMLNRGEFAARTAVMERDGYAINYEYTKNFSDNVVNILGDIQGEINDLFPDITPFKYKPKTGLYSWDQKATRAWISELDETIESNWVITDPSDRFPDGQYSLSVDSFTKFYDFRHNYPEESLGAQFVRYLKTKQNLNGFSANSKNKTIWDSVGRDGRVRPYTNIYRSQSSRSQPSSTSFMFLKAAWMRALVQPISGWSMGGIDYGSQEFLIAALESGDKNMIQAYASGDVYLWFGKACKRIPQDATKKSAAKMRDRFKSTVLGIMYLMMAASLSIKITNDTGEYCSEEEAQEFIDLFDEVFSKFSAFRDEIFYKYKEDGYLILDSGWTMWGNNPNHRSVKNCPIQGKGADIMRKAVALAQDVGLKIPFTLHDALYLESKTDEILEDMDKLAYCMDEAFRFYYPDCRELANVRLDGNIWGKDYPDEESKVFTPEGMEIKRQQIYVDPRSRKEYEKFKKYFVRDEILDLL